MANPVVQTAVCACPFGAAPAVLTVTGQQTVLMGGMPAATILDGAPFTNIPTFGMCSNPANPTVASATAAALGVLIFYLKVVNPRYMGRNLWWRGPRRRNE